MKILRRIATVLKWVGLILLIVVLLTTVFARIQGTPPSLFGYQINMVLTDSMAPSIRAGDVIINRTYHEGDPLELGDVVTYQGTRGNVAGRLITHEIVSLSEKPGGGWSVITQGTAPGAEPDPMIDSDQIQGVMVYKTVILKYIYRVITSTAGFLCLIVIPILLMIVCEILNIIKAAKKPADPGENCEKEHKNDAE